MPVVAKKTVFTPIFRLSYPNIVEPRKDDDGNPTDEYDCEAIFEDPKNMTPTEKAKWDAMIVLAKNAKFHKFGQEYPDGKVPNFKQPFESYDQFINRVIAEAVAANDNEPLSAEEEAKIREETRPELKGKVKAGLKSKKYQPGYCKMASNGNSVPIVDAKELYAGCYCIAEITAYAYEYKGKRGVSFGLNNIMKVRDGEPFSQQRNALQAFSAIDVQAEYGIDNSEALAPSVPDDDLGI